MRLWRGRLLGRYLVDEHAASWVPLLLRTVFTELRLVAFALRKRQSEELSAGAIGEDDDDQRDPVSILISDLRAVLGRVIRIKCVASRIMESSKAASS